MHGKTIARAIGVLSILFGSTLAVPIAVALWYGEPEVIAFCIALVGCVGLGGLTWLLGRVRPVESPGLRDGFIIVAIFWLLMGCLGAWPLVLSTNLSFMDAVFEAVSGVTTTGATVLVGLDELPRSVLIYRQQLQWLGGMGLIVLGVAVLPMLGIGGMQLYRAEAPGPLKEEKLTPRMASSARKLWSLYVGLTLLCGIAYWLAGMDPFNAWAHSLTTLSTGGFSTHDASIGYYDSAAIELIAIVFMTLAAINFGLHYIALNNGSLATYWRDIESRAFITLVLIAIAVVAAVRYLDASDTPALYSNLREVAFTVVSVVTSTGFATTDFSAWPGSTPIILLSIAFIGGCGGSTAGGMKVLRILLLVKQGVLEIDRLIHPHAHRPLRLGRRIVDDRLMQGVWGFFAAYLVSFVILVILMIESGLDPLSAFAAIATAMNNLGPGLGTVAYDFKAVSDVGKAIAVVAMLLGRLEIFTILVLLSPRFWMG